MIGMQHQSSHIHQLDQHVQAPSSSPSLTTSSRTSSTSPSFPAPPQSFAPSRPSLTIPQERSLRPKLSLNTSLDTTTQSRTFGKGSSLRVEALSAVSPTVRNTFSNAYRPPQTQSPATPDDTKPPSLRLDVVSLKIDSPTSPEQHSLSSATVSSASTTTSLDVSYMAYTLPAHHQSILTNSSLPRPMRRRSAKPMFPTPKKVSFRQPLWEEIRTFTFTLAHSDIASEPDSLILMPQEPSTSAPTIIVQQDSQSTSPVHMAQEGNNIAIPRGGLSLLKLTTSPCPPNNPERQSHSLLASPWKPGHKRDSSISDSDSDSSLAHTPVAGRSKRRRQWQ